jgi:uroporphyrinogen-III decarboxylase
MDPHLKPFETVEEGPDYVIVKTGFECTVKKRFDLPMPSYLHFDTQTAEQIEAFQFDDPADPRRYFEAGDDMINGVGDGFARNIPAFVERVRGFVEDLCVFGSVCEPFEAMWRIIGSENALLQLAEAPEAIERFAERLGDFMLGIGRAQIEAVGGALSGMYLWGDVAYRRAMLFSPALWRRMFKPQVQRLCEEFHRRGLPVIYHGCGNALPIFEDLIECGVDAYNPLEAKAGLDVVALRRQFGHRLGFNGNVDVTVLASGDREAIRREVLRKLNAAKGGGFLFQSDHSMPSNVAPDDYLYALHLCREFGVYPLSLGEFDEPME